MRDDANSAKAININLAIIIWFLRHSRNWSDMDRPVSLVAANSNPKTIPITKLKNQNQYHNPAIHNKVNRSMAEGSRTTQS